MAPTLLKQFKYLERYRGSSSDFLFYLLPIPEAPYLLLNILSFASLCFFAWYCTRRLPQMPKWFVWSWLLIAPWTIYLSTQIYNPSYVLPGAILFFVAAIETYPFLSKGLVPPGWANFMMGFALFWIMQFHLSWVVLVPYVALSFYFQIKESGRRIVSSIMWFAGGALITGSFLVPTFLKYGLTGGMGSTNESVGFNSDNLWRHLNIVEGVLGRFLSFASFELPRFIGANTAARLSFREGEPLADSYCCRIPHCSGHPPMCGAARLVVQKKAFAKRLGGSQILYARYGGPALHQLSVFAEVAGLSHFLFDHCRWRCYIASIAGASFSRKEAGRNLRPYSLSVVSFSILGWLLLISRHVSIYVERSRSRGGNQGQGLSTPR